MSGYGLTNFGVQGVGFRALGSKSVMDFVSRDRLRVDDVPYTRQWGGRA